MTDLCRIAIITDLHLTDDRSIGERKGYIADNLLERAIRRLNRWIKPDVTLFLGDLVNDGRTTQGQKYLKKLKGIIDTLESPCIVIPGNHDGPTEKFYETFEKPKEYIDIKRVRFIPFIDPEEPDYNARRTVRDIERLRSLIANHDGPVVTMQHVPIFPSGTVDCPYRMLNDSDVIDAMGEKSHVLNIAGHFHAGFDILRRKNLDFVAAPALCEPPFKFMEISVGESGTVHSTTHTLQMPPELNLVDHHVHTQLAYCSENMDIAKSLELAKLLSLREIIFTEHSGQLYFGADAFWSGKCFEEGMTSAVPENNRMPQFFEALNTNQVARSSAGFEIDIDYSANLLITKEDKDKAGFLLGAVHSLESLKHNNSKLAEAHREFLIRTEKLLSSGINVLAHPFRVFHRSGVAEKDFSPLFPDVIKLLKKYPVAAEMNFHTQQPSVKFVQMCLDEDIELSFGSDSHNLSEVGELWPHLRFLEKCKTQ